MDKVEKLSTPTEKTEKAVATAAPTPPIISSNPSTPNQPLSNCAKKPKSIPQKSEIKKEKSIKVKNIFCIKTEFILISKIFRFRKKLDQKMEAKNKQQLLLLVHQQQQQEFVQLQFLLLQQHLKRIIPK